MIDLDQLRASAQGEGDAVVTRPFLKQVAKELAEGRAAAAQLEAHIAMNGVVAAIERRGLQGIIR